jgi:hypothetical protein
MLWYETIFFADQSNFFWTRKYTPPGLIILLVQMFNKCTLKFLVRLPQLLGKELQGKKLKIMKTVNERI